MRRWSIKEKKRLFFRRRKRKNQKDHLMTYMKRGTSETVKEKRK